MNAAVQETISGISVAKAFRQEQVIYDQQMDEYQAAVQAQSAPAPTTPC